MKIGIIVPTRGDRPKFLENCLRLIQNQTLKPHVVKVVDFAPISDKKDITMRYRIGYTEMCAEHDLDLIAFMEDDDWYAPDYLETMAREWEKHCKPDIFGTNYTIYYHIFRKEWFTMYHYTRSSMMSTVIKPNLAINWCDDEQPYTDVHLWQQLKGITYKPEKHICLGIKHGIGLCGGYSHVDKRHRFTEKDFDGQFFKSIVGNVSFYESLGLVDDFEEIRSEIRKSLFG